MKKLVYKNDLGHTNHYVYLHNMGGLTGLDRQWADAFMRF